MDGGENKDRGENTEVGKKKTCMYTEREGMRGRVEGEVVRKGKEEEEREDGRKKLDWLGTEDGKKNGMEKTGKERLGKVEVGGKEGRKMWVERKGKGKRKRQLEEIDQVMDRAK